MVAGAAEHPGDRPQVQVVAVVGLVAGEDQVPLGQVFDVAGDVGAVCVDADDDLRAGDEADDLGVGGELPTAA